MERHGCRNIWNATGADDANVLHEEQWNVNIAHTVSSLNRPHLHAECHRGGYHCEHPFATSVGFQDGSSATGSSAPAGRVTFEGFLL